MPKADSIDPSLTEFVSKLMKSAQDDEKMSLEDKLSILDRGLKLEALKQRLKDDKFGSDFDDGDDNE